MTETTHTVEKLLSGGKVICNTTASNRELKWEVLLKLNNVILFYPARPAAAVLSQKIYINKYLI